MYKKARALQIEHFTGITSPYEIPVNADLEIDTNRASISEGVGKLLQLFAVPE
jgi:adenylylsulfate kinase-like enzyme